MAPDPDLLLGAPDLAAGYRQGASQAAIAMWGAGQEPADGFSEWFVACSDRAKRVLAEEGYAVEVEDDDEAEDDIEVIVPEIHDVGPNLNN